MVEQFLDDVRGACATEVVSLRRVAAELAECCGLCCGFDSFCGHAHSEGVGQ